MFCKTIILSNKENLNSNAPKGILSITSENNHVLGKIRLYNLAILPASSKLGIYVGGDVLVSGLTKRPNHYEFNLDKKIDLNKSMYCAIIDNSNGDKRVVLEGGNASGFSFTDSPADAVMEAQDEELDELISTSVDSCAMCSGCENCEYKKYFYEHFSPAPPNSEKQDSQLADLNSSQEESVNIIEPSSSVDIEMEEDYQSNNNLTPATNQNEDNKVLTHNPNLSEQPIGENSTLDITQNNNGISPNHAEANRINLSATEREIYYETSPIGANSTDLSEQPIEQKTENLSNTNQILSSTNNVPTFDSNSTPPNEANEDIPSETFLNDIIYQLDEMFKQYPNDELIMSIIPNSRFVKVSTDQSSPYILGVIYEDKIMRYIAYGVPASYNSLPPVDFGQNYQWLPLNPDDIMSDGYFMIYQDATNGQVVNLQIK